jgi:hypothetical protein
VGFVSSPTDGASLTELLHKVRANAHNILTLDGITVP